MRRNDPIHHLDEELKQLKIHWDEDRKRQGHAKLMDALSHVQDVRKARMRMASLAVSAVMFMTLSVVGFYVVGQLNSGGAPLSVDLLPPSEVDDDEAELAVDKDDSEQDSTDQEEAQVASLVEAFGEQLKMVSLLAPEDVLKEDITEYYGPYVTASLLEKWLADPTTAPGRLVSSPAPERIEIMKLEKIAVDEYRVEGNVVEVTSAASDNVDIEYPITLTVSYVDGQWLIDDVVVDNEIVFEEKTYGFTFVLPDTWTGYNVIKSEWEGFHVNEETVTGVLITIRHPDWSEDEPRQDIPIMVFSHDQWAAIQGGELSVGAAPIPPTELGQNEQYVFALPARYNFEFLPGYEEVEEILENEPLIPNSLN